MMNRTFLTSFAVFFLIATTLPNESKSDELPGHSPWFSSLTYDMAIPFGQASDFGGDFDPLGVGFDARYFLNPNWSLGFATGWQVLDQKTTTASQINNVTLHGTQLRYLNLLPLMVSGHYYLRQYVPQWCLPFGGLDVGTFWAERRVDVGLFSVSNSEWHFAVAPELGIAFRIKDVLPLLRFRYNHLFGSEGSDDLPYFNISIGAAWN